MYLDRLRVITVMDHGCDSMTIGMLMGGFSIFLSLDPATAGFFSMMGTIQWMGVAWEEHYTRILRMDYIAADESEYIAALLAVFTGYCGSVNIWDDATYTTMVHEQLDAYAPGDYTETFKSYITDDGELLAACLMVTMVLGLHDSCGYVKRHVAPDTGIEGWWSEAMLNALRDLLPYGFFLVGIFYWGTLLGPLLDDHLTQIMYIVAASAAFSRMAITLIHDTLTHLTVPMLQFEVRFPYPFPLMPSF